MFSSLIGNFESRKYQHFDSLIRSEDLAAVLLATIALRDNKASAHHQNSIISFSGFAKLDQLLNICKQRALEGLNMLLDYTLQNNEAVMSASPIVTKMIQTMPHIIHSARAFATDPNLDALLIDEYYSELIV